MTSRIRIKMGHLEIEYEGSEEFIKEELLGLLSSVSELYEESSFAIMSEEFEIPSLEVKQRKGSEPAVVTGTVRNIAAKLKCESGPDLIIATCAYLTLVENQETFTRKQILQEMQTASGFYKSSFSNNLTRNLQSLVKAGKLFELKPQTYSLNVQTRSELEEQLDA